jgi:hypothetical protein
VIFPLDLTSALATTSSKARRPRRLSCHRAASSSCSLLLLDLAGEATYRDREPLPRDTLTASKEPTSAVPSDAEVRLLEAEAAIVMMGQGATRWGLARPLNNREPLDLHHEGQGIKRKDLRRGPKRPEEAREVITRAGLPRRVPFAGLTAAAIADRFRRLAIRLHGQGKLKACYSVHDLRHVFAVWLYQATQDVYQAEKALGHANVAVAEGYLRSLGLAEGV